MVTVIEMRKAIGETVLIEEQTKLLEIEEEINCLFYLNFSFILLLLLPLVKSTSSCVCFMQFTW